MVTIIKENNQIVFNGDVEQEAIAKIMGAIIEFSQKENSNKDIIKDYTINPIQLMITSDGGLVYQMFALVDLMKATIDSGIPIVTYGFGLCASAGALILMSGSTRVASSHTKIMLHNMLYGTDIQSINEHKKNIERKNELQKELDDYICKKTKIKLKDLQKKCSQEDWWINSKEAKSLGIIDEIIGG